MRRVLAAATAAGLFVFAPEALALCSPPPAMCEGPGVELALYVLGSDAFGFGIIGAIGNGATLSKGTRPGTGWLTIGYFGASYNLVLAAADIGIAVDRTSGPGGMVLLSLGLAHLSVGALSLGLTAAAHARRRAGPRIGAPLDVVPLVLPTAGGASLGLGGRF